jgi:hypothetical protein
VGLFVLPLELRDLLEVFPPAKERCESEDQRSVLGHVSTSLL